MEYIKAGLDFILHIDKHLGDLIQTYANGTYLILFLIVFAETGLVVTPFLPGDSLLFAAGLFAGLGKINIGILYIVLLAAAVLGDSANYAIGKYLGPRLFRSETARFFKKEHLEKTHKFYEKYGPKTIILARFVPIVRTFAPFVAGIGTMHYRTFFLYNVVGGVLWVSICVFAGYFLGTFEIVRKNFEIAVLLIIAISVLPIMLEFWKARKEARSVASEVVAPAESK
jgi:membrane-associated protein